MQGAWVWSLVRELDPIACRNLEFTCHSQMSCMPQLKIPHAAAKIPKVAMKILHAPTKTQHSQKKQIFFKKKMDTVGRCLNIIKAINDKPHSWHHSQQWKAERISSKIINKTRMFTLAPFIQHTFGSPSHGNQTRKRNRRHPNWKRRRKTHCL